MTELVLIRHGETEWSASGRHTGLTDLPLTANGEQEARNAASVVAGWQVDHQVSSPLLRAKHTAELVGLTCPLAIDDRLAEWNYGEYEGKTTAELRETTPLWSIWTHQPTRGETADEVGARIDSFLHDLLEAHANDRVAVFAHGHLLAMLIARWIEMPAMEGRRFKLETATVTLAGHHREDRVLRVMNHRNNSVMPKDGPGEAKP